MPVPPVPPSYDTWATWSAWGFGVLDDPIKALKNCATRWREVGMGVWAVVPQGHQKIYHKHMGHMGFQQMRFQLSNPKKGTLGE